MKGKTLLNLLVLLVSLCLVSTSGYAQGKAPATKTPPATKQVQKKATDLIDINSATKQQLMTIPGIGDAYSQKIIEGRPYRAKNELVQKNIIPQATYDKISGLIVAKQSAAPAGKASEKKAAPKK